MTVMTVCLLVQSIDVMTIQTQTSPNFDLNTNSFSLSINQTNMAGALSA
jgi:hypothetical protein